MEPKSAFLCAKQSAYLPVPPFGLGEIYVVKYCSLTWMLAVDFDILSVFNNCSNFYRCTSPPYGLGSQFTAPGLLSQMFLLRPWFFGWWSIDYRKSAMSKK
jgi:hypothetical protein